MKKYLRFTLVLAAFASTSILACLPLSSASTSAGSSSAASPKRRNFFGSSVSKTEHSGKDASDGDGDDNEVVEETKPKKKTSWQFFYRNTEDVTAEEKEEDTKDDGKLKDSREEEEEDEEEDQKPAQEGTNAEDPASDNSEKNDDKGDTANGDKASSPSDCKDDDSEEDDTSKTEKTENDGKDEGEKEKDPDQGKESGEKNTNSVQQPSQDPNQQYRNLLMQQQRLMSPGSIIYRTVPSIGGHPLQQQQQQQQSGMLGQGQAMSVAAIVNLLSLASKLIFIKWIINRLAFESESKPPVQHFMWECLNDTYIKDDEIWNRVLSRVPHSMGISRRKWSKTVKSMVPNLLKEKKKKDRLAKKNRNKKKNVPKNPQPSVSTNDEKNQQQSTEIKPYTPPETSKTVVVMDFSTMNKPQSDFLRFADVVTFLVSSNQPQKQMFGQEPEIILTLQSPGGEVTSFAFAAAQVARLRDAGWNVTICVDRIAASGGYMVASQATQILASPFAMVGSVGVITESLNFYEILKKNGIQSLVMKAGDSKNPITQFGKVTDEDIKNTQEDLDDIHKSFIDLCRSRRPTLDLAVCNGRILSGDMALESGMIDRILTSDEYILEKISEGDLVMKLHLVSGNSERHMIANALNILPHLKSRFKKFVFAGGEKSMIGKWNAAVDGNFASKIVQMIGLASIIRRSIIRANWFEIKSNDQEMP